MIGRRVVPLLIAVGHSVTAVARTAGKAAVLSRAGATPLLLDLFDRASVHAAVNGHAVVVNLATSIPPGSRAFLPWAWRENSRIRRIVSAHLVDAAIAAGTVRFIQESFAPIYADGGDEWLEETAPIAPTSHTRAVVDAENATARFTSSGGTGVVLRFGLFYGSDSGFTRDMIKWIRKGWASSLGSPEGFISSVSHDDAAAAVLAVLQAAAGVYNVVDDEPVTKRVYFHSLAETVGSPPPRFPPGWLWRLGGSAGNILARSHRISNRRLKVATGWSPGSRSVREGWPEVVAGISASE